MNELEANEVKMKKYPTVDFFGVEVCNDGKSLDVRCDVMMWAIDKLLGKINESQWMNELAARDCIPDFTVNNLIEDLNKYLNLINVDFDVKLEPWASGNEMCLIASIKDIVRGYAEDLHSSNEASLQGKSFELKPYYEAIIEIQVVTKKLMLEFKDSLTKRIERDANIIW